MTEREIQAYEDLSEVATHLCQLSKKIEQLKFRIFPTEKEIIAKSEILIKLEVIKNTMTIDSFWQEKQEVFDFMMTNFDFILGEALKGATNELKGQTKR